MSDFQVDETNRCAICGHRDESRVGIRKHIMSHTTKEKLDALAERVAASEVDA